MVDDYLAVESSRLDFIRKNQTKCRVDCLRGRYDHVYNQPPQSPQIHNPGIPFYLPSSFQGSRRNMTESYHDAMSIVRTLRKPDLFVTFTCNEKWPEITSSLNPIHTRTSRGSVTLGGGGIIAPSGYSWLSGARSTKLGTAIHQDLINVFKKKKFADVKIFAPRGQKGHKIG